MSPDEKREMRMDEARLDQEEDDRAALAEYEAEFGEGNPEGDPNVNGAWYPLDR